MPGAYLWIWDTTNEKWVKAAGTATGALSIHAIVDELNDIGDVNVPTPADDDLLYWDETAGKWQDIAHLGVADAHHTKTVNASELTAGELPTARLSTNIKTLTITFIIDGGGSAITTGEKGHLEIPFACTITGWTILADQSGSIVVDVWKDTYALFPPTVGDTIAGTEKPTLATAQKNQDLDLTTWTTAIAAGDVLAFYVESITTVERVTISLKVVKT